MAPVIYPHFHIFPISSSETSIIINSINKIFSSKNRFLIFFLLDFAKGIYN